jgi:hypothetical protein
MSPRRTAFQGWGVGCRQVLIEMIEFVLYLLTPFVLGLAWPRLGRYSGTA